MNTQNSKFINPKVTSTPNIELELLTFDLDSCTRCVGTLDNIETAIDKVKSVLEITGTEIKVNKILIESEEEAKASACCSAEKQETCCEPSEKEDCCVTKKSETCGCQ